MVSWPQEQNPRVCLVPVLGSIHPQSTASETERTWLEDPGQNHQVIAERALGETEQ